MSFSRKMTAVLVSTIFVVSSLSIVSPLFQTTQAAQSVDITQVTKVGRKAVTLQIKESGMENKVGMVNVEIKNESNGKVKNRDYRVKFDGSAMGKVRVRALKSGTKYSFKVRERGSDGNFGSYSDSEMIQTQS